MAAQILLHRTVSFLKQRNHLCIRHEVLSTLSVIQIEKHLPPLVSRLQDCSAIRRGSHRHLFSSQRFLCILRFLCRIFAFLPGHAVYGCAFPVSIHNCQIISAVIHTESRQSAISLQSDRQAVRDPCKILRIFRNYVLVPGHSVLCVPSFHQNRYILSCQNTGTPVSLPGTIRLNGCRNFSVVRNAVQLRCSVRIVRGIQK